MLSLHRFIILLISIQSLFNFINTSETIPYIGKGCKLTDTYENLDSFDNSNLGLSIVSTLSYVVTVPPDMLEYMNHNCSCDKYETNDEFNRTKESIGTVLLKPALWKEQWLSCKKYGGHLAVPTTKWEHQLMMTMMSQQNANYAYLGIHDLFDEGHFITVHGEEFAPNSNFYFNSSAEPSNFGNEDCLVIIRNGLLNDVDCYTFVAHAFCTVTREFC